MELDLNGHTVETNFNNPVFVVNGAKLTLKGGNINAKKNVVRVNNGGEVRIESGTYDSKNEAFKAVGTGSKITLNGGTVKSVECALGVNQGAVLEMNGGLVQTSDNMGIGTNGNAGQGGNTITMNGGRIEANIVTAGYEAIGVYIANSDVFVMNGGEIVANNGTGLCMRAGDVTINNGTIIATGEPGHDGKIADDPTIMTGTSAIIYHESANYPAKEGMKLTVKGGTITGVDHSVQVLSNEITPNVHVSGGTLTPAYPEA